MKPDKGVRSELDGIGRILGVLRLFQEHVGRDVFVKPIRDHVLPLFKSGELHGIIADPLGNFI